MRLRSPLPAARRHPSLAFGVAGGGFALLFVVAVSAPAPLGGDYAPSAVEALLVGGFVGGVLLARLLSTRLDGMRSPVRGAAVGALIGPLALPVPMYALELAAVARRAGRGSVGVRSRSRPSPGHVPVPVSGLRGDGSRRTRFSLS